ncbi:hypothetical protein GQR58_024034 [Nymphon striatum]|nr:hypothetical protein GQR58_024034 [Nymphon striatum]
MLVKYLLLLLLGPRARRRGYGVTSLTPFLNNSNELERFSFFSILEKYERFHAEIIFLDCNCQENGVRVAEARSWNGTNIRSNSVIFYHVNGTNGTFKKQKEHILIGKNSKYFCESSAEHERYLNNISLHVIYPSTSPSSSSNLSPSFCHGIFNSIFNTSPADLLAMCPKEYPEVTSGYFAKERSPEDPFFGAPLTSLNYDQDFQKSGPGSQDFLFQKVSASTAEPMKSGGNHIISIYFFSSVCTCTTNTTNTTNTTKLGSFHKYDCSIFCCCGSRSSTSFGDHQHLAIDGILSETVVIPLTNGLILMICSIFCCCGSRSSTSFEDHQHLAIDGMLSETVINAAIRSQIHSLPVEGSTLSLELLSHMNLFHRHFNIDNIGHNICYEEDSLSYRDIQPLVLENNNHKEADTLMILHAMLASQRNADVLVLAIAN